MLRTYALITAVATFLLVIAGGLVTSTKSGLAVPDWPLSYGMLFPPMVGGILYEHGHRMVAGTVAGLTAVLAVWLWRAERRRWVRRLGLLALGAVLLQALLGGLTVLFLLPLPVSVAHACLGQTFFSLVVAIAVATSRGWTAPGERGAPDRRIVRLGVATTATIYLQLVLGALVRHSGAALAIPDFPLALGRIVPPLGDPLVAIHFAHRVGALLVVALAAALAARVRARRRSEAALVRPASLLAALTALQVLFGALAVWTRTAVPVATAHVATGALLLALSLAVTMRAARGSLRGEVAGVAGGAAAAGTAASVGLPGSVGLTGPREVLS